MTTGQRIQQARKKAGLSQKQLGEKLGLSASMIGQWENDLRNPKYETLQRISTVLETPWLDLAGDAAFDIMVGPKVARQLQKAVDLHNAVLEILRNLYGEVNDKDAEGAYGSEHYYLVGKPGKQFVLYEKDMDALEKIVVNTVSVLVEQMKDPRPVQEIVSELEKDLNSEKSRLELNAAVTDMAKKYPEYADVLQPVPPPHNAPQSFPPLSEGKDTTPPPNAPETPENGG